VRFTLLGDVEATHDGVPVDLGPARQRSVLAALLIDLNRVVPAGQLIDRVWSTRAPRSARETLRSYMSRLRATIGADAVLRRSGGYLLRADPATVDLFVFHDLVTRARAADDEVAADLYRRALALWRGVPFGAVDTPWFAEVRDELDAERIAVDLDRFDAELRLGAPGRLVTELVALAAARPLDERVTGQLMLALYSDGRRGEALDRYRQARRSLRDELGVDPGPALQRLHHQMLVGDPALTPSPVPVTTTDRKPMVPAQLPPDLADFAGRATHLAALDGRLTGSGNAVVVLSGPAGIGKTALTLHWAHRIRDRFVDGQLYVNLRGFDADAPAMTTAEALRGFLVALGVVPQRIPAGLDEAASLYRSLMSDRRLLVVLDNANSAGQVRPLVATGLTVITSRLPLTGLVAADGAHPVTVGLLSPVESRELLARRLGPRVDAEPDAVAGIIASCGRLPLALAVVAARAATRPHLSLGEIAAELKETGGGLDALATGDPATDVRSVFSWSYRRLSPSAGRVFRLLGRHLGPDISAAATASLTALPAPVLAPLLAELVDAHLIVATGNGRYGMHDLLRAYATELSRTDDDGLHRLLDHYLRTAYAAAMLVDPYREPIDLPSPLPASTPEPVLTPAQALDWFTAEHEVLLAAVTGPGRPEYRWRLAWCLVNALDRRGYWHDQATAHLAALDAAVGLGDLIGQAHSHRGLARAYVHLDRRPEAREHFDLAIDRCREADDDLQRALVLRNVAELLEYEGRYDTAVTYAEQAIEIFQATGYAAGLSNTLHQLGWYRALLGDYPRALVDLGRALALLEAADHRYGQAHSLDSLGYVHTHLGDHDLAIDCLNRALGLFEEEGDRYFQAVALDHLGDAHHAAGSPAQDSWQRALTILDDLAHPDSARVRAKLHPAPIS
jgi:DNA-binding SARP family transcriptional activator/tetratricopeptide (TPR) repeat protein